jgi:hypothetical protein
LFTDDVLDVVAADVVELDSVLVEVVQDAQAELVALSVVRLGNSTAGNGKKIFLIELNDIA